VGDAKLRAKGKADQAEDGWQNRGRRAEGHAAQGLRRLKRTRPGSHGAGVPPPCLASCGDALSQIAGTSLMQISGADRRLC
jgi:hypothetical protein